MTRCNAYAEYSSSGLGCSLPVGHEGNHKGANLDLVPDLFETNLLPREVQRHIEEKLAADYDGDPGKLIPDLKALLQQITPENRQALVCDTPPHIERKVRELISEAVALAHCRSHTVTCEFKGCTCGAGAEHGRRLTDFLRLARELESLF